MMHIAQGVARCLFSAARVAGYSVRHRSSKMVFSKEQKERTFARATIGGYLLKSLECRVSGSTAKRWDKLYVSTFASKKKLNEGERCDHPVRIVKPELLAQARSIELGSKIIVTGTVVEFDFVSSKGQKFKGIGIQAEEIKTISAPVDPSARTCGFTDVSIRGFTPKKPLQQVIKSGNAKAKPRHWLKMSVCTFPAIGGVNEATEHLVRAFLPALVDMNVPKGSEILIVGTLDQFVCQVGRKTVTYSGVKADKIEIISLRAAGVSGDDDPDDDDDPGAGTSSGDDESDNEDELIAAYA